MNIQDRSAETSSRSDFLIRWIVYVVVALIMMWPVTFRLADEFVGWRDANYYVWLSWELGELIQSFDIFSFRIPDIVHPLGVDLRLLDGQLPSLYGGVLNLFFGPVLSLQPHAADGYFVKSVGGRTTRCRFSPRTGSSGWWWPLHLLWRPASLCG